MLAEQKEMAEVVEDNNDSKLLEPVDDATNDEEGTVLYVSNLTRYKFLEEGTLCCSDTSIY